MLAIVCPGQGSQTPGFLDPWLEVEGVRDRLGELAAAAELDLIGHGTHSDADTIKDTAVAQPLIVAAGLATVPAVLAGRAVADVAGVVSGHSVGELTAAALAGVLTPVEAVAVVRQRGRAMAQASAVAATGMSAVLGGEAEEVVATLERLGLTPANRNGAGQIVAAGTDRQLAALAAAPPARAKVIPLAVAGAFHTEHMAPAVGALEAAVAGVSPRDAALDLISNRDGQVVASGADVVRRLVEQVARPVRWDLVMERLAALGVTGLIELAPAGTLVGLAKRGLKGVEAVALKTPDDLPRAATLIAEHGGA